MDKHCQDCKYRAGKGQGYDCDYLAVTGSSRGGKPGKLCTKKERGPRVGAKSASDRTDGFARRRWDEEDRL